MAPAGRAHTSASLLDVSWWSTDRVIAVVGTVITVIALLLAIWQLVRTRRAAEAARVASRATHRVLRTSDLRRALEVSLEVGRRINAERGKSLAAYQIHLDDWLTTAHRVFGLISSGNLPTQQHSQLISAMEAARGEVLVARSATASADGWRRYDRGELRAALIPYGDEAESMIVSGDESLVDDGAS